MNRDHQKGSTLVETAIGSVVLMMLVVGIVDFGRVHFTRSNLKHAVSQSVRYGITGNSETNRNGTKVRRERTIRKKIRQLSGFKVKNRDITIGAVNSDGELVNGAGGPGDVVTVQATYRIKLLAPYMTLVLHKGRFEFTAATSFRNEEFSAALSPPFELAAEKKMLS